MSLDLETLVRIRQTDHRAGARAGVCADAIPEGVANLCRHASDEDSRPQLEHPATEIPPDADRNAFEEQDDEHLRERNSGSPHGLVVNGSGMSMPPAQR